MTQTDKSSCGGPISFAKLSSHSLSDLDQPAREEENNVIGKIIVHSFKNKLCCDKKNMNFQNELSTCVILETNRPGDKASKIVLKET